MNPLICPALKPSPRVPIDFWHAPALIALNNFIFKSLSNWAFNLAVGCCHACRFCYVPSAATIKQGPQLARYGVTDPDAEWGSYVLLRLWDERKFLASLRAAERTPPASLKPDGNRAVMYCSTTDPYQVIHHPDPARQRELSAHARFLVRRSLELIRDQSTLNVRILTRSPLAREDFDLFRSFGHRLMFGLSLPTLRNDLSKVYEPKAPAPTQRLAALQAAKEAGLHVYVAMAPTYPECDEADLRATLSAVAELKPLTIFHESINIRAENVARIEAHAAQLGIQMKTDVFATREAWQDYAIGSLQTVQRLAAELGLAERLHSWPDKSLGNRAVLQRVPDPAQFHTWLQQSWSRISEWPGMSHRPPDVTRLTVFPRPFADPARPPLDGSSSPAPTRALLLPSTSSASARAGQLPSRQSDCGLPEAHATNPWKSERRFDRMEECMNSSNSGSNVSSPASNLRQTGGQVSSLDHADWLRQLQGAVLIFAGFVLSPLSSWSGLRVNEPLALALGWFFSLFYPPAFKPAVVVGCELTNALGFLFVSIGAQTILRKPAQCRVGVDIAIAVLYTAVMFALVQLGVWSAAWVSSLPK